VRDVSLFGVLNKVKNSVGSA